VAHKTSIVELGRDLLCHCLKEINQGIDSRFSNNLNLHAVATSVVDTGGNLPPVLLIPVVHLDLRISPRIFEKIRNGPNGILWGEGKLIHGKNQRQKV
jgi:hypothetical protein